MTSLGLNAFQILSDGQPLDFIGSGQTDAISSLYERMNSLLRPQTIRIVLSQFLAENPRTLFIIDDVYLKEAVDLFANLNVSINLTRLAQLISLVLHNRYFNPSRGLFAHRPMSDIPLKQRRCLWGGREVVVSQLWHRFNWWEFGSRDYSTYWWKFCSHGKTPGLCSSRYATVDFWTVKINCFTLDCKLSWISCNLASWTLLNASHTIKILP